MVTDDVGALGFPVNSKKFPPTFNLVLSFSYFYVFNSHTIFPYATILYFWTCVFGMNITVFVTFTVLIPWYNCPSSFPNDRYQTFMSGPLTRCLYSWSTPYIFWVTTLASLTSRGCYDNAKSGTGFFLQMYLKLELGTPVSTLGGCAGRTLGGDTGKYGIMMFGPEWYMWTLS